MPKHTPGPWKMETVPISNGAGSCHKIGPYPTGIDWRPETHACVYADGFRIGIDDNLPIAAELRANARLIAAAPALCEALKAILDDYEPAASEWIGDAYASASIRISMARAALRQAGVDDA